MKLSNLYLWFRQKPRIAFIMCLPLILMVVCLIIYPFFFSIFLATLNKAETKFVGIANFLFLFKRETFWLVVQQSILFALVAVFFKALIGFVAAHSINELPSKGQRKWRGMLLVPWVIPPALSTLGWWWLFEPTYSALNWMLGKLSIDAIPWLSETFWARFSIILVNIWVGAPFFLIMYLAALKSIPEDLYEASSIDGANYWQKLFYITLPMMKNIISITILFSIIVTFANFDIVRVLTRGGPIDTTHLFATYAFRVGIESGDIPLGATVSLFMFPVLAILSFVILRNVQKRSKEV
tara:strand:+ start:463 stop:1350 length:888 start_codon:yes stop_codon:yes gene_type:complete